MPDGDDLYRLVAEYAAFGDHRTGSPADAATAVWFAERLAGHCGRVAMDGLVFDRWVCAGTLTADGEPVEHLPAPYSFLGGRRTDRVHVEAEPLRDPHRGGAFDVYAPAIARAREARADACVVAIDHADGDLVAANRRPCPEAGPPVIQVAARDLDRLRGAAVRLDVRAHLEPAWSGNIRAGALDAEHPVVVTTPLTGWFGCAGERGTGVAVLLAVVERFAGSHPLLVLGATGHELDYLGVRRAVAGLSTRPAAVLHLGASLAVTDGGPDLVTTRSARATADLPGLAGAGAALQDIGLPPRVDPPEFLGEGGVWRASGAPLLSLSGAGRDFHSPADTPARATDGAALARVTDAVAAALGAVLDGVGA